MKLFRYLRHYTSDKSNHVPSQIQDDKLIRYLLGDLGGKEEASLEQEYFRDDGQFEHLRAMEDELIDRYLRGELSAREHRRFETHFLASPLRRERVHSAKALLEAIAPTAMRSRRSNFWEIHWKPLAWSLSCLLLVLLTSLTWLIWKNVSLQHQLAVAKLTLEHSAPAMQSDGARSGPLAMSFVLEPVERGLENPNRLIVPVEAQLLSFSVGLPASPQSAYRGIFRTPDGDQVGASTDITVRPSKAGISATITIPSAVFSPGTYILTLQGSRPGSGFQDVKSYSFTIVRR